MKEIDANIVETDPVVILCVRLNLGGWPQNRDFLYTVADIISSVAFERENLKEFSRALINAVYTQDQTEKAKRE